MLFRTSSERLEAAAAEACRLLVRDSMHGRVLLDMEAAPKRLEAIRNAMIAPMLLQRKCKIEVDQTIRKPNISVQLGRSSSGGEMTLKQHEYSGHARKSSYRLPVFGQTLSLINE